MIPSLFLPEKLTEGRTITVSGSQAHHVADVLRLKPGDSVYILDGRGARCLAEILETGRSAVVVRTGPPEQLNTESPLKLVLAQAVLKGDKMDVVVRKATELGCFSLIPVIAERCQVRRSARAHRWRKIAESASAQSGRAVVPEICEPVLLKDLIRDHSGTGIVFWENAAEGLQRVLDSIRTEGITLLTGPEGGFTAYEVRQAEDAGFIRASLGPRILRAETAAVTATALAQYALGDMGTGRRG